MTPRLRRHVAIASAVLTVAIWLSSGTMAPYAATVEHAHVIEPCHYLVNVDHDQFIAIFRMLRGEEIESWLGSVMLRRMLFQAIAVPFANIFGILAGGLIASIIVHLVALAGFAGFIQRRVGESAAIGVAWLLATYPGITYWSGLPYSYVVIVPGSLACMMLLYRLQEAEIPRDVATASLLMGVIFLGYDLFAFFGPAAVLILLARRRVAWAVLSIVAMASLLVILGGLFVLIGVPVVNSSTGNYFNILHAYLHPGDIGVWVRYLMSVPAILASNFLFGNFIVFPLLFSVAAIVARRRKWSVFERPDVALLVAALALFVFNNAAPAYYGWQLRGHWIARLYQPVFPAFLIVIARVSQRVATETWWRATMAVGVLFNASVAFGPVMMNPIAAQVDRAFYIHSPAESLLVNMRRYGRRPLGLCRTTHEWDNLTDPGTPLNRPSYMFRYPPR